MSESTVSPTDFIRRAINEDLAAGRVPHIRTRFPPEPNGYLHIGHVKAIVIDFGIAADYGGTCNLRFDDTNPIKEDTEYVEGIKEDIRWLGFDWDNLFYASDYFAQLYQWAVALIKAGKAYVDDLSAEQIREYRGTLTEPGKNSPYRDRSIEENLDLFERMKNGEFEDGSRILRAKVDMSSPIINMRDPAMYRIMHTAHHRTGDKWCIYPMYDWAHGQSDSLEGITYSLCSLEFENHRPLYEWFIENLDIFPSRQIEFARLNLTYILTSKRKLLKLVQSGKVSGWDDPRMPTIRGLRRRGYTPSMLKRLIADTGIAKTNSVVDYAQLEHIVRNELNHDTARVMGVLKPLKLVITNYPEGQTEEFPVPNYPQDRSNESRRMVPFGREIYIEQDDFAEVPPPKYKRLIIGRTIRLIGAYFVTATEVVKDDAGNIVEVHCEYDPATRGGVKPEGGKNPKGTIHWVSAEHAVPATVRLYDRLFQVPNPGKERDFMEDLNPDSLELLENALVEPSLAEASIGDRFQFMRNGYFVIDQDSTAEKLVFNRTITLRDTWAK